MKEIKKYILESDFRKAAQELLLELNSNSKNHFSELLIENFGREIEIIIGRTNTLNRDILQGTVSYENVLIEKNRIRAALLEVYSCLEKKK